MRVDRGPGAMSFVFISNSVLVSESVTVFSHVSGVSAGLPRLATVKDTSIGSYSRNEGYDEDEPTSVAFFTQKYYSKRSCGKELVARRETR